MFRIITVSILMILVLSGCKPSAKAYDKNPIRFSISKEFSQKEVSEIILLSLMNLKYTINDPKEGRISANLIKGSLDARVVLEYKENQIVILNQSTRTYPMPREQSQNKKTYEINDVPYNWLVNIKREIENESLKRLNAQKLKDITK